jgi:putative phosphoesterase
VTRIGVLSDSHGRAAITARAVEALLGAGADILIHLGDVETEAVIDELVGPPAHLVFGNCDWDVDALARYARNVGVIVDHPAGRIDVGAKSVIFTHGDRPGVVEQAIAEGVDYLLHGHTHVVRDERVGCTRVINPGALFRAARYTAAVLEPETDRLEIIEVPHAPAAGAP